MGICIGILVLLRYIVIRLVNKLHGYGIRMVRYTVIMVRLSYAIPAIVLGIVMEFCTVWMAQLLNVRMELPIGILKASY